MTRPAGAARLAGLTPGELDEHQRRLYAEITGGPRGHGPRPFELTDGSGALVGPFNAMLLQPPIGSALQALGSAIRYRGSLPARARELAILVVAAHWHSEFEWAAHEAIGRAAGLSEDEMAAIAAGHGPDLADPAERAVVKAARALAGAGDLDDAEYRDTLAALGAAGIFELTTLVGYYATLALEMRVFRVTGPAAPEPGPS